MSQNLGDSVEYTLKYTLTARTMRTNIVMDDELVEEAFSLTRVRTKRELVHLALSELVRIKRKKNLLDLAGKIEFSPDFDHKSMRHLRDGIS